MYLDLASESWIELTNLTQPRIYSTMLYVNGTNKILALLLQLECIISIRDLLNLYHVI
jgi:hypothetical protein